MDELPAYSIEDKWASLFEVIAPYKVLCRVPIPEGYTTRTSWPESMWEVPLANVPKATLWQSGQIKSTQSWIKVGQRFRFKRLNISEESQRDLKPCI